MQFSDFKGYYEPNVDHTDAVWKDALIVLDANSLLNLYRYKSDVVESFLSVLEDFSPRVWLPSYVAFEFIRGRSSVIRDQIKAYKDVRETASKHISAIVNDFEVAQVKVRHHHINVDKFLKSIDNCKKDFESYIEETSAADPLVRGEDRIIDRLEVIVGDKIFPELKDLDVSTADKEAERRLKKAFPPGYKDINKKGSHSYLGKEFTSAHGDYYIWSQIIEISKKEKGDIIFVTDDAKEDWWWIEGGKKLRIRPELDEEFQRFTDGRSIVAYSSERFLKRASSVLGRTADDSELKNIREVATSRALRSTAENMSLFSKRAERAVFSFISNLFDAVDTDVSGFDMRYFNSLLDEFIYVEVLPIRLGRSDGLLRPRIRQLARMMEDLEIYSLHVFFVVENFDECETLVHRLDTIASDGLPERLVLFLAELKEDEYGEETVHLKRNWETKE